MPNHPRRTRTAAIWVSLAEPINVDIIAPLAVLPKGYYCVPADALESVFHPDNWSAWRQALAEDGEDP
ncbi:hypothetical protein NS891_12845, partial [Pseudomonas aeruginosa]|nr:hypothetical protein [Pseudomonas aeruginosa]